MRRRHVWTALVAAVVTIGSIAAAGAPAQGAAEKPKAAEVGVTDKEIHIAVIADVNNSIVPGIFKGAADAVQAWGNYINNSCKPKNTCLAGRKVVVDFLDSKLSADAARDSVLKACEQDVAIVGTHMLFLNNIAPEVDCKDQAGATTGIPDVAAFQTSFDHQCSPVAYTISGTIMDCATRTQHPQTYRASVGHADYLKKKFHLTKGSWIANNDIKGSLDATLPLMTAERTTGLKGDNFLTSGRAPQTTFTPYVQSLQRDGVQYVSNWGACYSLIATQKEARIQGVTSVKAYTSTTACYSKAFLNEPTSEGTYVWLPYLPVEDGGKSKTVSTMVNAVGKDKIDGFGILAWESALLFKAAVDQIVKTKGVNAVTRANLIDTFKNMHSFNDGLRGTIDPGAKLGSACVVIMKVHNGKFVREFPKQPGTLSCKQSEYIRVKYDNQS
jgi:hypothetical protein